MSNPSLLLIPDRYKAGKLYSQIPDSGAGDLSFTRVGDTATRVNQAGLIESVPANIPRIDYTGGGCGKLLLEPQRTNLVTFSEQFNNAAWIQSVPAGTLTLTANYAISPDGYLNADRIQYTGGSQFVQLYQILAHSTNAFSIYAKSNTGSNQSFRIWGNDFAQVSSDFTITSSWQRFDFAVTGTGSKGVGIATSSTGSALDISIYGAQFEAGSYPTSYIPTLGASVTRSADSASKTEISSLIGQTSGSAMIDVNLSLLSSVGVLLTLSNGTFANFIILAINSSNQFELVWRTNAGPVNLFVAAASAGRSKIAVGYQAGNIVFFVNGVLINTGGVDVNWSAPLSRLDLGNELGVTTRTQRHNAAALYPVRLSNSELAQLTTL